MASRYDVVIQKAGEEIQTALNFPIDAGNRYQIASELVTAVAMLKLSGMREDQGATLFVHIWRGYKEG